MSMSSDCCKRRVLTRYMFKHLERYTSKGNREINAGKGPVIFLEEVTVICNGTTMSSDCYKRE